MGLLRREDASAWRLAAARMQGPLRHAFLECGGEASPTARGRALVPAPGDYAALAGYLALEGQKK